MQIHSDNVWMVAVVVIVQSVGCRANTDAPKGGESSAPTPRAAPPASSIDRIPELEVPQLESGAEVKLDGTLNEPCWASAATTGEFVNVSNGAPNERRDIGGSARLLWNNDALFVGIEIRDVDIRGDFGKNTVDPHLWTESTAEIMIEPDGNGDNRDYYEIQIGPQNLTFDSRFDDYNQPRVLPDGPFGHQEWSAEATRAVIVNGTLNRSDDRDQGYTVEARIPWKVFAKAKTIPPRPGDQWRMNFYAMHNNGGVAWSPILGQGNFHRASRFGKVTWAGATSEKVKNSSAGAGRGP